MGPSTPVTTSAAADLEAILIRHEGLRLHPYRDTVGKLTIGVGRNLDDVGLSREEALALMANDVARVQAGLDAEHAWWRKLDPVRQNALVDMTYNLGLTGLDGFVLVLADLRGGAYVEASREMLRSKWAQQVGQRACDLAFMIRTGSSQITASSEA